MRKHNSSTTTVLDIEMRVPDMEEIGDVRQVEVEVEGFKEGPVGADVEAIDPRVGQPGPWRRRVGVALPTSGGVGVLLPGKSGVAGGGRKADKPKGGHDGLQLVVGHDGLEGSGEPQRKLL
jgi:hypothetical protein